MNNLLWEDVENYYKKWYDQEMNKRITEMALAGVQYNDPAKAKTTFYKDYIDESSRSRKKLSLKDELKQKLNVREVVKRPKFLFEKVEAG